MSFRGYHGRADGRLARPGRRRRDRGDRGPLARCFSPQPPPGNGTGPRVDVDRAARRIATLPHRVLAYRAPTSRRWWSRWRSPGMTLRACGWCAGRAASARRPPRRHAGPCLPAAAGRAQHPRLHRMAGRQQRRHRGLRAAHVQRSCGTAPREAAAGLQRALREVRDAARTPPGNRRTAGEAGSLWLRITQSARAWTFHVSGDGA